MAVTKEEGQITVSLQQKCIRDLAADSQGQTIQHVKQDLRKYLKNPTPKALSNQLNRHQGPPILPKTVI